VAGLGVLLDGKITAQGALRNGFEASWSSISAPMQALQRLQ
jgi:hypothetical protein